MGVGIEGLRMWLKLFDWDACAFQISVRHCQSCQHMLGLSMRQMALQPIMRCLVFAFINH